MAKGELVVPCSVSAGKRGGSDPGLDLSLGLGLPLGLGAQHGSCPLLSRW